MLTFTDDEVKARIQEEVGIKPGFALESFPDLDADSSRTKTPSGALSTRWRRAVRARPLSPASGPYCPWPSEKPGSPSNS